jgi:hypothetical protein
MAFQPEGAWDVKLTGIPPVVLGIVALAYLGLGGITFLMRPMRRTRQRAVAPWNTLDPPIILSLSRRI